MSSYLYSPDFNSGIYLLPTIEPDLKILIADDHKMIREFIVSLVQKSFLNAEITECGDGEEAVSLAQKEYYDLILMDLLMKKMDGFTAIKKIKAAGLNSKIIVVSQISEKEFKDEVLLLGAHFFLNKENLLQLPDIINHLLGNESNY